MAGLTIDQALQLAVNHHQAGRLGEAEQIYRQILTAVPNHSDALHLLGVLAHQCGQHAAAVELIGKSIQQNPQSAEYHCNLGEAHRAAGQREQAMAAYRAAIQINPGFAAAHYNLANVLKDAGQLDAAMGEYRAAIQFKPDFCEAHVNLGAVLTTRGKLDEAIDAFSAAIQCNPDSAEAYNNLGIALKDQGKLDEAIDAYRKAILLKPDYIEAHSALILTTIYHPKYDSAAIGAEARKWDEQHAKPLAALIRPHENDRSPDRRLKIGYISPNFKNHCQAFFTVPLFREHDHTAFEIHCFSDVAPPDAITAQLRGYADHWHNILGQSDDQVADLIRQQRIDILVDLTMHMGDSRLLVMARKPAPVQVCWLAFPGTTGLTAIDYRLSDSYLDPPGIDESVYSERTVRLPDSFWCYDPLDGREIEVNPLSAESNGFITFGCLNNFCKVNEITLGLWAQVMQQVPNSRLLLLAGEGKHRNAAKAFFEERGIGPQRIEFFTFRPRNDYLELYHQIDVGLDSVPCPGHTTSLDSWWMGVPVVTLVGQTPVARAGWCQLSNLGLTDLAAHTPEEYVEIAMKLANDLPRLEELRRTARDRMQASALMDAPRFARNVEVAYRRMWLKWCKGD